MSKNAAPTSRASRGGPEGAAGHGAGRARAGGAHRVTTARDWVAGARPRTLPAAIVPVVVGTAVAAAGGSVIWWRSLYALIVAVGIQIGTNYANDYSDGVRGTDAERVGPVRLVASHLAEPGEVKAAAFYAFGVAGVAGLVLALATTPWLLVLGALCVAAGWFYSGGSRPYGYAGFGEVFVFVFFGLVAVVGTAYVNLGRVTALAVLAAVPVGFLATALLVVNNLRDIESDTKAGKKTLAVRSGDRATRGLYAGLLIGSFVLVVVIAFSRPAALLTLLAIGAALGPLRRVLGGASGHSLISALVATGTLQLAFGALLALGIAL
jgi:1,4-dihydroxy-2-naphthoate octaprenyltransferase